MIIVLVGASATGKDSVAQELIHRYGYKNVISYTTRKPRDGEVDGVNYHFVSQETFDSMQADGEFVEVDKYSGERWYGSRYKDYYTVEKTVTILTPNGVRQLTKNGIRDKFFVVYLHSPLAEKCKRYVTREQKSFSIDKLMELTRRSIADAEMFRGFEDEADLVVENDDTCTIEEIANLIVNEAEDWADDETFNSFLDRLLEDDEDE